MIGLALGLTACGTATDSKPDNFGCAAMLTAYTTAVQDGDIANDAELTPSAYMAVMFHLNAWAIPQNIREADAFEQIKEEATRLRESASTDEMVETARWCIDNKPSFDR